MQALVYHGPGQKSWDEVPDPEITDDTDAIVRVDATTICGTDLHILKGDVPEVQPGPDPRPRGRRARSRGRRRASKNVARRPGAGLVHHRVRDLPVLPGGPLRPVPGRGRLDPRPQIDGTQAEYVRVPFADTSTYRFPPAWPTRRS